MPGCQLWQFAEEVQRFASSYEPPVADVKRVPIYIGGWPSANFFLADEGQLVMSTLLYSGQVYAKDPLSDWFAPERYGNEHLMASRRGFLNEDGSPNIAGTRRFLRLVVPALVALRPLIASGALVLVPSERFFAAHMDTINELRSKLLDCLARDPVTMLQPFHPSELAVDDRVKGAFVFAGGDKEEQLRRAADSSLRYFAREWLLSQGVGADYAAPWRYEQYIGEHGLDQLIASSQQKVVNALLHTELPLFQGLTPKVVASIRDDETFVDFREKLFEVYREVPGLGPDAKFARELAQSEEALLRPTLERAEAEAKRGFLKRAGVALTEMTVSVGARVLYDQATGQLGWNSVGREAVGVLADRVRFKGARSPLTAWTKLYKHQRSLPEEIRRTRVQQATHPDDSAWSIDEQPSMSVRVSSGLLLFDEIVPEPQSAPDGADYSEGPYRPCECGSGLKWKFCCKDVGR